jgi:predicted DNA-binding transcriptional regulator AlpA
MCESKPKGNGCHRCQERLLSVEATAFKLGISPKSIRNQLSQGVFPIKAHKLGGRVLFKLSQVAKFIDNLPEITKEVQEAEEETK